jgi:hypothetical protein
VIILLALLTVVKDDTYSVSVVKAPKEALSVGDDGEYILDQDEITETVQTMEVRGAKNAAARLAKMAEKHSATAVSDTAAIAKLLGVKAVKAAAAAPVSTGKAPPAAPAAKGSAAKPPVKPASMVKREAEAAAKPVKEVKVKEPKAPKAPKAPEVVINPNFEVELAALEFTAPQVTKLKNSPKSVNTIIDNAIPASAVMILPNGGARILDSKLPAGHAYLTREGAPEPKVKAVKEPKAKVAKAPTAASIKGYKLEATKAAWGDNRWYNVGTTVDKAEVERVAAEWEAAGFTTRTTELTRGAPKHTLWVTPGEPIVSLIPGDLWVGDHLGPHLKALGVDPKAYRTEYSYTGPMVALRAAASLAAAHTQVRREHMARAGGLLVEVLGDEQATLYRVDSITGDQYALTILTSSVEGVEPGAATMSAVEVVNRTKPVSKWTTTDVKRAAQAAK